MAGVASQPSARVGPWRVDRLVLVFGALAVLARLDFWIVTNRVWEDALITVTHARNAVDGLGLTHHPGDGLTYGFTSAISVLIPLAGEAVAKGSGIFVLRAASLIAVAVAIVFAARICRRLDLGTWPTALVLAYLAFDQNQIFYGMAGMETQVAVAVLLWSVDALMARGILQTGISLGVSLLVRPDFVIWMAAAALDLALREWRRAVRILIVAALVVLPWIVFTALYYGSPVPNTILAKAASFVAPLPPLTDVPAILGWIGDAFGDHALAVVRTFAPFYEDSLVTAAPIPLGLSLFVSVLVWVLAIAGAIRTWRIPGWRAAVLFAGLFTAYRLTLLPGAYFDWYVPPHAAILIVLAAAGLQSIVPDRRFDPRPVLAGAIGLAFLVHTPFSLGLEAKLQSNIEDDVRAAAGTELGRLMRPSDVLASESAGYYEYYSNASMLDYPGLTSVRARQLLASLPPNHRSLIDFLGLVQADWMALRPAEWAGLQADHPEIAARYDVVDTFSSPSGSIEMTKDGLPRIAFGPYVKDASSWRILLLHRVR